MKIKTKPATLAQVLAMPQPKRREPRRTAPLLRFITWAAAIPDLRATKFHLIRKDALPKQPCLILMNHSCFLDIEIIAHALFPHPFSFVMTSDGFVGQARLMYSLGAIPTKKFLTDRELPYQMRHALKNGSYVVMYPEASYSFDGTATPLPRRLGLLLKLLKVPVVMMTTRGAFLRDPLYNGLRKRKVTVEATQEILFTPEEIETLSVPELDARLDKAFTFDHFAWQRDHQIAVTEPFRAEGLERIAYKCPLCGREGELKGEGTSLQCHACGGQWTLSPYGVLEGNIFNHVPDWYAWERREVRRELEAGTYCVDCRVSIRVLRDYRAIYEIGTGRLRHDQNGFQLWDENGNLLVTQSPNQSYGLYADYYWYELGDMVCIGDRELLYYCFPEENVPVAKLRLATEELYKMVKRK